MEHRIKVLFSSETRMKKDANRKINHLKSLAQITKWLV